MKVLITSSRRALRPPMIAKLETLVALARRVNDTVLVGDAEGGDTVVKDACLKLGVPLIVHGAYGRCKFTDLPDWVEVVIYDEDYLYRDRQMAEKADMVFAVWTGITNGPDKSTGTAYTAKYAIGLGKPVTVSNYFADDTPKVTQFIRGVPIPDGL